MDGWWAVSYVVLWLLVIVLCLIVVALARQIGTLHLRLGPRGALEIDAEGPALGEAPPAVETEALGGTSVTVGGPGGRQVLLFISPGCHLCEQVTPAMRAIAAEGTFSPFVISDADAYETVASLKHKEISAPVIPAPSLARDYRVPGTPYVVVLDELGVVRAKGTANNLEQIEGLLDTALDRSRRSVEAHTG